MRFITCCALTLGLGTTSALAQNLDCTNPQTQIEMTGCAAQAYEYADDDLNLAYGIAMDHARRIDQGLSTDALPAASALRDAQRAWIPFRDLACTTESLVARGGSMQNMLYYICLERLTRQRTEDLRLFGETH